jgi:nucleoside-diphosphate kinase
MTERTLVIVKPDGVERGLVGEIVKRIESKGYRLVAVDLLTPDPATLERHYVEHADKPFFRALVEFMSSGQVFAIVVEGDRVIAGIRSLAGATDPTVAAPGTIRGDFAREWDAPVMRNLVHGSDSEVSAAREIAIWFPHL